jgi:cytochrome bd-type quinol oxidase subunit 2
MMTTARAALLAAVVLLARGAMACPSCAGSASPKDPNIWPLVGLFMLVPWILAVGAVWLVRRESRTA